MQRRQMVVDVHHPGRANVSKKELQERMAKMYKVNDLDRVILFDFRTAFGGGKSSGFCCIYDSVELAKKMHTKHHLWRLGIIEKTEKKGRKGIKEAKNRSKKVRGLGRQLARKQAKRNES